MSRRDQQALLVLMGVGLIAAGHKLIDSEIGKLGLPHVMGASLISLALRL